MFLSPRMLYVIRSPLKLALPSGIAYGSHLSYIAGTSRLDTNYANGGLCRCYSLESSTDDEYRNRKVLILKESSQYYPPLRSLPKNYDEKLRINAFLNRYSSTDFSQYDNKRAPETINLQGKVALVRKNGKYMYFIDLVQDMKKVQIMTSNKMVDVSKEDFHNIHSVFRKGDYINCVGNPSVSNTGELLLKLTEPIQMLSPCLNSMVLPDQLSDKKLINSNRVLNYLVGSEARERIVIRNLVIKYIREFLVTKEFMEVQTPLISGTSTGATAKPFVTRSGYIDSDLQLRVAPELWLKKLVISGFERIFEIGYSYRNEGIDATHNPEFTTCEFYQSFADLDDLMALTQDLFKYLHQKLLEEAHRGQLLLLQEVLPKLQELTQPFERIEFIPTLEKMSGLELPATLDSASLVEYHEKLGLDVPAVKSPAVLLDNLASIYLETLTQDSFKPAFIYNHPAALAPLSKSADISYGNRTYDVSLRLEVVIDGMEYINAYEEENSPDVQLEKFKAQQASKIDFNDEEAMIPDWNYVKLMEFGLPPTGGWGCGIDRLSMLFSGSERIEQVLPFGSLRDVLKN